MTAPARISQDDIERAVKAVVRSGGKGRVRLDLEARVVEIILGEQGPPPRADEWTDEDV